MESTASAKNFGLTGRSRIASWRNERFSSRIRQIRKCEADQEDDFPLDASSSAATVGTTQTFTLASTSLCK